MSPEPAMINQLRWWLALPPTNLIARGDLVRFHHALFMIIHQIFAALYDLNHRPLPETYAGLRDRLEALTIRPEACGARLERMASASDPYQRWSIASGLIEAVLRLAVREETFHGVFPDVERSRPVAGLEALAHAAAQRYRRIEGVDAVALTGSLARGAADRLSDVDLSVYCRSLPDPDARAAMLTVLPDVQRVRIEHACDTAWVEGTLIHVRYWLAEDVERMLAALPRPPSDVFLAEDLQLCQPVYDTAGQLGRWKQGVETFPKQLMAQMLETVRQRRLKLTQAWHDALTARDRLHLYCLANRAAHDWLIALFALNHRFLSTPRWSRHEMQTFSIVPPGSEKRITAIAGPIHDWQEVEGRWRRLMALWEALEGRG